MLQEILAISLVLALLAGTLLLLRRSGVAHFATRLRPSSGQKREMRSLERLVLTPQSSLHLVSVREKVFLLAVSPSGCNRIDVLSSDQNVPDVQGLS